MNIKTFDALMSSIRKWDKIANGSGVDLGTKNCALCQLFFDNEGCLGCPVRQHTGRGGCISTPYELWSNLPGGGKDRALVQAIFDEDRGWAAVSDYARSIARAEADFLRSLISDPVSEVTKTVQRVMRRL